MRIDAGSTLEADGIKVFICQSFVSENLLIPKDKPMTKKEFLEYLVKNGFATLMKD